MNDINYLISNGIDVDSGIELLSDIETYNETLQEFLRLSNEKVENLKKYKNSNDLENYSIYAHSIKSDARYLGFNKLSEITLNHENQSKNGNKAFIDSDFDNLINEVNRVRQVVITYLGDKAFEEKNEEDQVQTLAPLDKAILVVDDSEMIREFIKKSLIGSYDIIMATDGKKAIEKLEGAESDKIQGMFLDLNMPRFNGFDVLKYFDEKELFDKFPISIITGSDDKDSIDKAFQYPIVDMLVKPFTEEDVKRIVERTVSSKKN